MASVKETVEEEETLSANVASGVDEINVDASGSGTEGENKAFCSLDVSSDEEDQRKKPPIVKKTTASQENSSNRIAQLLHQIYVVNPLYPYFCISSL